MNRNEYRPEDFARRRRNKAIFLGLVFLNGLVVGVTGTLLLQLVIW